MDFSFIVDKILESLHHSITISSFVLFLMVILEIVNLKSRAYVLNNISRNQYVELLISILMGLIPGNFGSFMAVSLYTHGALSFGALVANIIAAFGDDLLVFVYYSLHQTLLFIAVIAAIAFIVGFIVNHLYKQQAEEYEEVDTSEVEEMINSSRVKMFNIFNIKFESRAKVITLILFFLVFILSAIDGQHNHSTSPTTSYSWKEFFYILIGCISLYFVLASDSKFFRKTFLNQIVKPKIIMVFISVFIVVTILSLLPDTAIKGVVHSKYFIVLPISIALGLIPISGINIIFILLFVNGDIPLGILLANSIVQDGMSSLPLYSESKIDYFKVKGISVLVAIVVGVLFWFIK